jgi:hypothetical protein
MRFVLLSFILFFIPKTALASHEYFDSAQYNNNYLNVSYGYKLINLQNNNYTTPSINLGFGWQQAKFFNMGAFFEQSSYQNNTNNFTLNNIGIESKLVFRSPFVNIAGGGKLFISLTKEQLKESSQSTYGGSGYNLELSKALNSNFSLITSLEQQYAFSEKGSPTLNRQAKTQYEAIHGALGFSFWY